jgi:hypothetical protein
MKESQVGFESQVERFIYMLFAAAGAAALCLVFMDHHANRESRKREDLRKLKEDLDSLDKEDV